MKIQFRNEYITVFESQLFRTTTTVVQTDDLVLLVDPNWLPTEIGFLQNYIAKILNNKPLYLLFTHSDYDHIIGYQAFKGAKTIASDAFIKNKEKEAILLQINQFDHDFYLKRNYAISYPEIDILVKKDGQQLSIGKTKMTFYLAPGHNADGIFTIIENVNCWIAGDYLSNIEFPFIYHSSLSYEMTLDKADYILKNHKIELLISGHGDCTSQLDEIKKRRDESIQYIQTLRKSIQTNKPFNEATLWEKYAFPLLQKKYHQANIDLIKKELGK